MRRSESSNRLPKLYRRESSVPQTHERFYSAYMPHKSELKAKSCSRRLMILFVNASVFSLECVCAAWDPYEGGCEPK